MMCCTRTAITTALAVVALASHAAAQDTRRPSPQEICAAAEAVVAHARSPQLLTFAYAVVEKCPNAGATLARAWVTPPTDSIGLLRLSMTSRAISDRRLLDATLPIVQNAGAPEAQRRAALGVVLAQFASHVVMMDATWSDPEHSSLGARSDTYQTAGEQPIAAADRQRIIDTFRQMGAANGTALWGRVARRIVISLAATH